jgi:uncharacterized protein
VAGRAENRRDHRERRPEWPADLDVGTLRAEGWRPVPFWQFILKVHSRCNLACDYCYMYEMADQGWREQPHAMSPAVAERAAERIGEHVRAHGLAEIELVLHGGEPLLAGPQLIRRAVTATRSACGPEVIVRVGVQTNGTLLTTTFLDLFDELDIAIGVSVDGDASAHDRHRTHLDGRGSHAEVQAGLRRLITGHRGLFGGLLTTVDLDNDPVAVYESLLEFAPPAVDLLLPHGNWTVPPPGHRTAPPPRDGVQPWRDATAAPYGDWLIAVFDRWYGAPVRETRIRLFGEIIRGLLGAVPRIEAIGLSPAAMAVVETDGSLEQVDTLKSAYPGAAGTGLHVGRDGFDAMLALPGIAARQLGTAALASACRTCSEHHTCGGGQYAHRYRAGAGFANPSVYCPDLFRLIRHVRRAISRDLAAREEG